MSYHAQERALKRRWMEEHGYTLEKWLGVYDIRIAVPSHTMNGEAIPYSKHMIRVEEVESMTIDQLESFDKSVWLKARQEINRLALATNRAERRKDKPT